MGEEYEFMMPKPGCRGTLKRPYDINEWNKAELLDQIDKDCDTQSKLREEIEKLRASVRWYKARHKSVRKAVER